MILQTSLSSLRVSCKRALFKHFIEGMKNLIYFISFSVVVLILYSESIFRFTKYFTLSVYKVESGSCLVSLGIGRIFSVAPLT